MVFRYYNLNLRNVEIAELNLYQALMKKYLFTLFFLINFLLIAQAREPVLSRANFGVNLAALYSGLPELQTSFFLNRYLGISASAGYMNKPRSGGIKIDTYDYLTESKGAFLKLGLTGRFVSLKKAWKTPVLWLRVQYVYSEFFENGYTLPEYPDTITIYRQFQGSLSGLAIAYGVDFPIWKGLDIRLGHQIGFYHRSNHFGIAGNVYQSGLGAQPGLIQLGLNWRFGKIPLSNPKPSK